MFQGPSWSRSYGSWVKTPLMMWDLAPAPQNLRIYLSLRIFSN